MFAINIILLLILAPLAIISQSVNFPKASNATIKALLNIGDKKEMDVIIAVESSKSPNANTVCSLEALQNIVYLIDAKLPLSRTGSNIGIIKYGELATIFLNIKTGYRVPAVFSVLRNMKPFGGNISRLDLAIAMAQRMFIGGGRISAVKKLIILTSRPPAKDPVPSAKLIKTINAEVFVFPAAESTTNATAKAQLNATASLPLITHIGASEDYCSFSDIVFHYNF